MAHAAGHDINYIALAGTLEPLGRRGEQPTAPVNLVGDFGGGGMLLAFGVACALVERGSSGQGQVIDAAMVDGASALMTMMYGMHGLGVWRDDRGENLLDTGSHFYDTYETKDGKYVSIGSIEPQFYAELIKLTGLEGEELPRRSQGLFVAQPYYSMVGPRWPASDEGGARDRSAGFLAALPNMGPMGYDVRPRQDGFLTSSQGVIDALKDSAVISISTHGNSTGFWLFLRPGNGQPDRSQQHEYFSRAQLAGEGTQRKLKGFHAAVLRSRSSRPVSSSRTRSQRSASAMS